MGRKRDVFEGLNTQPVTTLDEACDKYGLNRPVEKRALHFKDANGNDITSPNHAQVVDIETEFPLGVVGVDYELVPFATSWAFVEPLIQAGAKIVGGGAPGHGVRGYLVLESPGHVQVGGHRIINRYVLTSAHDGSGKIEVRVTPYDERTHIIVTTTKTATISFKHTKNVRDRLSQARKVNRAIEREWESFTESSKRMLGVTLSDTEARDFIAAVLGDSDSTRSDNMREDVYQVWKNSGQGAKIPGLKGTLFGMIHAFAEWGQFRRNVRKRKHLDATEAALDTRLRGDAVSKVAKAWGVALTIQKKLGV